MVNVIFTGPELALLFRFHVTHSGVADHTVTAYATRADEGGIKTTYAMH